MKNLTSLLLLLLSVYYLNAQQLSEIDIKITEYPKTFTDVKDLANLINTDFDTDEKKARAIYSWIALNVKYDIKAQFSKKRKKRIKYKNQLDRALKLRKQSLAKINKALHENKATSEGYANLFKELCDLSGLYCYTIKGTGKIRTFDIGKQPRVLNHSWNVVQINKKWFFIDATLGAGSVDYVEKKY
ncbi:MAG: transglutaminase, partial [Mariniphaga sp.]|nr:transglutaminase [Mariniphaga sp.]